MADTLADAHTAPRRRFDDTTPADDPPRDDPIQEWTSARVEDPEKGRVHPAPGEEAGDQARQRQRLHRAVHGGLFRPRPAVDSRLLLVRREVPGAAAARLEHGRRLRSD